MMHMNSNSDIQVSLVINTKNEEQNIAECIESAGELPDEIVVCDMHSTDLTREIAESLGARVVLHKPEAIVEKARSFAVKQARGEWIMLLDADERATSALLDELRMFIDREDVNAVWVRWRFLFMGKFLTHTSLGYVRKPLLFRRIPYLQVAPLDQDCDLRKGSFETLAKLPGQARAKERFIHLAYPSMDKYVEKTLHYYSRQYAQDWLADGGRPNLAMLVMRPLRVFLGSYFLRQGFRDGVEGLIFSVLFAMHFFLIAANMHDLLKRD